MKKIDMDQVRDYRLCLLLAEKQSNNRRFNSMDGLCLRAVKENGMILEYIKNPTEELCIEAVRQNGYALEYVREQTEEMCIEAVKQLRGVTI